MIPTDPPAIHAPVKHLQERWILLAIAEVESGNRWSARGAAGELGAYQIKRSVWDQHMQGSGYSFDLFATNQAVGTVCAKLHLHWLEHHLALRGIPVTARNVATCWRCGLEGGVNAIKALAWPESADRVQNLYEEEDQP